MGKLTANKTNITLATLVLVFIGMGCDSPPWSRFVIANSTSSDIIVRFYTPHPTMASPYLYTVEEWKEKQHFTSGTAKDRFRTNEEEGWVEADVSPGAAVEIDRASYPEVEENIEGNLLIDRLDIQGPTGNVSIIGRKAIYEQFQKEWIGAYRYITGTSPLFVYYVRQ